MFVAIGYPHNTYHGPAKHYRPLLNSLAMAEPTWYPDSPQHSQHHNTNYSPVPALKQLTPAPSPRRKSSTSIEPQEVLGIILSLHFNVNAIYNLFTIFDSYKKNWLRNVKSVNFFNISERVMNNN